MTLKRWTGSAFTDLTQLKRWNGSAWVDLTLLKKWNGSAWVDVPLPGGGGATLNATISNGSAYGAEFRLSPPAQPSVLTVGSDSPSQVTVSATGGTGPYSYLWTHESGDSAVQVVAPTSATTGFVANVGKSQSKSAVKRCTITDSLGATTAVLCSVTLEYIYEF